MTIPDSVTSIGNFAFYKCTSLKSTIPDSVTSIGPQAFALNALTSLTIPNSVTTISKHAFLRNALTKVAFEGNYFSGFKLDMFDGNENLVAITYCEGATGWPQTFNIIEFVPIPRLIASTSVNCSPTPDAPTIDSIVSGNGQATITFTPGANNGSPITGYRYIKDNGVVSLPDFATTGSRPFDITIETSGNVYTTNSDSDTVSKITPDGISAYLGATGDNPKGIAIDAAGNIYTAN